MFGIKKIALCVIAMLILSGIVTSAALAASPAWWVAGNLLKAGEKEAVAETTKVIKAFKIEGGGVGVECSSIQIEKGAIEGENTGHEQALIFKGCKVFTQESCSVVSTTTKPLKETLEGKAGAFKLNFEPTSGTEVGTVELSGTGCITKKFIITGTMACEYPKVESEAFAHVLDFTVISGSKLESIINGLPVKIKLTGEDEFWLASEKHWFVK